MGAAGGALTGTYPNPGIGVGQVVDAHVSATAAIQKSKLAPLAITDADISATAAISKSKLAPLAITDADISVSAAIAQSKLSLAITDTQVAANAGIQKSKLAALNILNADIAAGAGIAWSKIDKTGASITDLPSGTLTVARGGTGITASGAAGNVLRSTGTAWASSALSIADLSAVSGTSPATASAYVVTATAQAPGAAGNTLRSTGTAWTPAALSVADLSTATTGTGSIVLGVAPTITGASQIGIGEMYLAIKSFQGGGGTFYSNTMDMSNASYAIMWGTIAGIGGVGGYASGKFFIMINRTAAQFVVHHNSASETNAAGRIYCSDNADDYLDPNAMGLFVYDGTISRWYFGSLF
jgi:hypothetical protein